MPYQYPSDFDSSLPGFGGNTAKNQQQHRDALTASNFTVTILLHGQVANAFHPTWGMETLRDNLVEKGVPKELIFACSWLGERNTAKHTDYPVAKNIDAVRAWIDSIIDYFGGNIKVNVIGHSLGGMMAKGWLYGYKSDHSWDNENLGKVSILNTLVLLASNNYGLGTFMPTEFATDSSFEENSHKWYGIVEDSASGCDEKEDMISPEQSWKRTTQYDDDGRKYIAIIAVNDYVDQFQKDTSRIEGANKNLRRDLGISVVGHEAIIKKNSIVSELIDELQALITTKLSVNRDSGNYGSDLQITVSVDPSNLDVSYVAQRLTKEMEMGYIEEKVEETLTGKLSDGESLTLSPDGMWDVTFTADGAGEIKRTYAVNVILPVVTIDTPNEPDFDNSLEVSASTTKGTLYYSFNGIQFNDKIPVTIEEDRVIYFIAIDEDGLASPIVSRVYRKKVRPTDVKNGTATEHYLAGRLDVTGYITMGNKYGYIQKFNLYLIDGKWTDNYSETTVDRTVPKLDVNYDGGTYSEAISIIIKATDDEDPAPVIYYTTDGSRPTESSPHRASSVTVVFDVNGSYQLKYLAKDRSANKTDVVTKAYTISLPTPRPDVTADLESGEYSEAITVTLSPRYGATVYFTEDGSTPDTNSNSFTSAKQFIIQGNGNHAIRCLCLSDGLRVYRDFNYTIDDLNYPETGVAPSRGGIYVNAVEITFTPSEQVEWTKYTTDGSVPDETNGLLYTEPFTLSETTTLKWRSQDQQGNMEPVNQAVFTITKESQEAVFDNDKHKDGYIRTNADGSGRSIGTFSHLALGVSSDGRINRAILHFDTALIPDNATLTRAFLQVKYFSGSGDPWEGENQLVVDVNKGYFGSSLSLQTDDWDEAATAEAVATIEQFAGGTKNSSDFNQTGLNAINKTGITQVRLRFEPNPSGTYKYVFFKQGPEAKLFVEYTI